jgi:hypothetical protein
MYNPSKALVVAFRSKFFFFFLFSLFYFIFVITANHSFCLIEIIFSLIFYRCLAVTSLTKRKKYINIYIRAESVLTERYCSSVLI